MMRLTRRELWLVTALAAFAGVWVLFIFSIKPAIDRIETLNRVIPEKQGELEQLRIKAGEYVDLHDKFNDLHSKITSQDQAFEMLPFMEGLVRESNLENNVVTMKQTISKLETKYHETVVEIKMENLTLRQLVEFLWKIRSTESVATTKSLYIKKNLTEKNLLDSVVEVCNFKPAKN